STREGTERLQGAAVTSNTFDFLGVPPVMGRGIRPEDGKPGATPVFVMSYKMWQKYFSGDRQLLTNSRTTDSRDAAKSAELDLPCEPRPAACALLGKT